MNKDRAIEATAAFLAAAIKGTCSATRRNSYYLAHRVQPLIGSVAPTCISA
jgi:hypothetical protein